MRALPLLLLLAASAWAEPDPGPFERIAVIRLREKGGESIDPSVRDSVVRRIEAARAWGADCVVLDIESYGGRVDSSIETGDELFALGREIHTIAYVHRRAFSGAALLSIACNEIVMSEAAKIGDAQAIVPTADGMAKAPEKAQTVVATAFRTYAEGNGYPVPVVEAMVREEIQVVRYQQRLPDGAHAWVYFREDPQELPTRREMEEQGLEEPPEIVVREGELATFSANQAREYGLASRLENTLPGLIESLRAEEGRVIHYEWTWAERVSRFLLTWRFLLFLLGAGALYFALKMPGTGIPEALAVVAFGLFFGASAIADFAGAVEVILFFVGVGLLVVEIFVLPGFGVPGFLGLAFILASIGLAAIPEASGLGELPENAGEQLLYTMRDFLLAVFVSFGAVVVLARYLPTLPLFHRLALEPAARQTGSAAAAPGREALVGATGTAESQLRPAGRARIDGETVDVVAEGRFVAPGTRVRIVSVQGNRILVRAEPTAER